jgi:AraC-like DNA-binding protein
VLDIATPSRPARLPGVSMAGFSVRTSDLFDLRVVPYPAVTIFIDFGDGLLIDDASGRQQRGNVVAGLAPSAIRARGAEAAYGDDVEVMQVRLSPLAAFAAMSASPEMSGTMIALDDLWSRDAGRFREQLHAAGSWDARFAMAEAALAGRIEAGRTVDPEVAFAWGQMVGSRGQVRVEELAAEAGWSRKRLWSRFGSQIGLTPKRAAKLIRFDHAAHRLAAGHSAAMVAADGGYVDQSHLHRDVMAFAGVTPTAVAVAPWLAVDPVAWAAPEYLS